MPGVIAVLTGKDVLAAGHKSMPAAAPMKGRGGSDQRVPPRYSLTPEACATSANPSRSSSPKRRRRRRTPPKRWSSTTTSCPRCSPRRPRSPPARRSCTTRAPGNLVLDFVGGDEAATDAAFARAARSSRSPPTTRAWSAIRWSRAPRGDLRRRRPTLHAVRDHAGRRADARAAVDAMLGVPPEKVRVVAEEVGGGFGVRFNVYPEYGALLLAAKTLGRAGEVDRQPLGGVRRRRAGARHRPQGRARAGRERAHARPCASSTSPTLGAYLAFTGTFINTVNLVNVASGVYDVPAVYVQAKLALTNTAPTAAYRGAGRPVTSYAHGAAGRPGRARTRHRPGRVPPPQPGAEVEVPVQDRHRLRVRLRRLRRRARQGARHGRLEWF